MEGHKNQKHEHITRGKDLEREIERLKGENEALRHQLSAAQKEQELRHHSHQTTQRQAELITAFLEKMPGRGGQEMQPVREELGALTQSNAALHSPPRGAEAGAYGPGRGQPQGGGYTDGRAMQGGSMPWAAANAGVFRSVPGI